MLSIAIITGRIPYLGQLATTAKMNYDHLPIEQSISGIYYSPILSASFFGFLLAWLIARVMNRFRLARYVWHPPLFFVALMMICTVLVGRIFIPI